MPYATSLTNRIVPGFTSKRTDRRRISFSLSLMLLVTLGLGLSCSDKSPVESGPVGDIPVTVTPISGPPLTSVTVLGLDSMNVDLTGTYAYINGFLAPLFVSDSGVVRVTIPAIVDSVTMWIDTSVTSMSLVIVKAQSGDTVAIGEDIFTLEALLPAPGSVAQMLTDWGTIATSLQTISQALGGMPGVQEQYSTALLSALDSLINGSDSLSLKSLTNKLTAGNPQELALLDALFGSSGVAEQSQKYAVMFQAMADSAALIGGPVLNRGAIVPTIITDKQLAFAMQFYVVIREFGRTVIAPTAQTYAIVTGAIGLVGNIPIASVISATLSVIDFIVNRYVISLLPASIDSLRITVVEDTIFVGEQTNATVNIYAANDPQAITFNDLVAQVLNGLGLTASLLGPRQLNSLTDLFENVANYMVALLQTGVSSYAQSHPALNLDFTVTTMPVMKWEAQITDTKFLNVKSHTPTIIKPVAGVVQWQADSSNTGEGRIFATTTASGATVIPEPTGFAYSAGAFGENVAGAPAVSVWSLKKLAMVVDMAPDISHGGINILGVKVGTLNAAGDTTFEAGFKVDLTPIGGTATPSTGFTDATGQFNSDIRLDAQSDTVIIHITALNTTSGSAAKDTATAAVPLASNSRIAYVSFRDGRPGIWSVNSEDTSDNFKLCTVVPIESNPFPVHSIFWSKDSQWLLYSMGGFFGTGIYTTGARSLNYQRTILDPRNYEIQAPNSQSWFTTNPKEFLISAAGKRSSSSIRGQFLCTAAGFRTLITGTELLSRAGMFISPDEQTVVYAAGCGTNTYCFFTLDANNLANGTPTRIAPPFSDNNIRGTLIGWTEDGTAILYAISDASIPASETTAIRMVNKNGSNNRLIGSVTGGFGSFTFLRTRNALAFYTISNPGNNNLVYALYTLDFSGNLQNITGVQSSFYALSSSPDGTKLVYDKSKRPADNLYMLDLATSQETLFLSDTSAHVPSWSGIMQQ